MLGDDLEPEEVRALELDKDILDEVFASLVWVEVLKCNVVKHEVDEPLLDEIGAHDPFDPEFLPFQLLKSVV